MIFFTWDSVYYMLLFLGHNIAWIFRCYIKEIANDMANNICVIIGLEIVDGLHNSIYLTSCIFEFT